MRGILTAAHVLTHLPDSGAVGIVEYRGEGIHYRKRTIEMANTTKIVLSGDAFGPDGPDLGLLRLATDTIGWFDAIGSFYNLLKHRSDASQSAPSDHSTDAVVGMIDERTKDLPAERRGERRKGFEALFSNGTVSAEREVGGYDLFDFAPTDYPDFKLPGDYSGTSGGAVWRIYLKIDGEKPEVAGSGSGAYRTTRRGRRAVATFWPVTAWPASTACYSMPSLQNGPKRQAKSEDGLSERQTRPWRRNVNAPEGFVPAKEQSDADGQ